ncbi:MAG: NAD(P)/FAD-dependent oxidoreductase [Eubacteriales bacterium]
MFDVAVVGAGVTGGMVARELTRQGLAVCLLEKESDVAMGASRANSGIVHAGYDALPGTLKATLNVRGAAMMEQVASELGVSFRRCGSLVVGFDEADRQTLRRLYERGLTNGVSGLELLSRQAVHDKEPNLTEEVCEALWVPTGAIICPYGLTIAAIGNAMDNGAELLTGFAVSALEKTPEGWQLQGADGRQVTARAVVNCAGLYADEVARMAGDHSFTIRARRGEYLMLDRACGGLVNHTVFMTPSERGKGVLVTPTAHGNLLVGPSSEDIDDKGDTATTAAGLAAVKSKASRSVRGIPFHRVITSFSGLRAVGSSGDFIINMPLPGFVNCAGIESPGLTAAPAIALYVAELLRAAGYPLSPRTDFVPVRRKNPIFRELTDDEKNRLIREDPRYGRVVCRCETVTEGELVAAIHQHPRPHDMDALKRRTRCGMGRCQGGFCTPLVQEILARETGIPEQAVTKSGRESYLYVGQTK